MTNEPEHPQGTYVGILTPEPLGRILTYRAPEGGCNTGDFVQVPLGPRKVIGTVWGPSDTEIATSKIRQIHMVLDFAPLRAEMREFLVRAADYTLTPLTQMFRLATRSPGLGDPPAMRTVYRRGATQPARMTEARTRVLQALETYGDAAVTLAELAQAANVSPGVVKGLVAQKAIFEEASPRDQPYPPLDANRAGHELTKDQAVAAAALCENVGRYSTTLLKGVTGSGKTEVYMEAIAAHLKIGQQALVLLPEIALTSAFLKRIEQRFGARPAEWHSGVTLTERRRLWRMIGEGGASLVVGARSALFLPFQNLGLIIVDEEHDSSYKQDEGVLYNARDMAVLRASICGAQVVLASATPSLETWANAKAGKYNRLDLTSRFGEATLPDTHTIDMRQEELPSTLWVSKTLQKSIHTRISAGEQSLLFVNRRGYAPITLCRACGHQVGCQHCDARMVEHRHQNRLMCHQCGETTPIPSSCPHCDVKDKLAPIGPGVERLAEEVTELFPRARVRVLSSDLFNTARALKDEIEAIAAGKADIIIGTQLVAKGHNFPLLTLVGVIDADLGLQGSDLRAAERTFQLIRQVAGRAGRAERPGQALLQTYQPDHPVIRAIIEGNEEAFWQAEATEREATGMPPYGRLAGVIISSPDLKAAFDLGNHLARNDAPLRAIGASVWGPAPAPIAKIRGRHRVRLLVKAAKGSTVQDALKRWVAPIKRPTNLRLSIDIDPQNFY